MDRYVCKQCGRAYNYCRACVLKPIPWRAAGFCSRECSAAFKAPKIEIPEVSTNEIEVEVKPRVKRKPKAQVEPEVQIENIIEAVSAVEVDTAEPDGIHE